MSIKSFATVALAAFIGAPLSAQVVARNDSSVAERVEAARRRIESRRERARMDSVLRSGGASSRVGSRVGSRGSSRVPPGHLPPRGMCRVWIDGVPPGRQPPVTDCITAEANRTVNSRVIYGDRESFPGNGKGKFKNRDAAQASRSCSIWDEVVVGGQSIPVCRDGSVRRDRRTSGRFEGDDDDRFEDDDDDRGRGKLAKAQGKAGKAAKNKGKGGRGK